ncbi:type II toxin-antitoxin system HicA family toxin [Mesorhizobium sp. M2A.F.Ca.ET.043.05.1.1]|uniref:type II toxin-antitoxin system HicA family toxin n=1 Tax=Mesorhizobium sp. M2A.F.Ca.ET.043.05.1.1 TaxID=2493671 RepID=UPI0032B1465A
MSATSSRMRSALARKMSEEGEICEVKAGIDDPQMISYFSITSGSRPNPRGTDHKGIRLGRAKAMKAAHRQTLDKIFANPVSASIKWRDVETLLVALGARVSEGRGSRVRFTLNGITLRVHRPHPSPDTKAYVVREIRTFLIDSGVEL